jgi:hypothetical protein
MAEEGLKTYWETPKVRRRTLIHLL